MFNNVDRQIHASRLCFPHTVERTPAVGHLVTFGNVKIIQAKHVTANININILTQKLDVWPYKTALSRHSAIFRRDIRVIIFRFCLNIPLQHYYFNLVWFIFRIWQLYHGLACQPGVRNAHAWGITFPVCCHYWVWVSVSVFGLGIRLVCRIL